MPLSVTRSNGGISLSKHRLTRPSRKADLTLPLIVSAEVMSTISSPSRSIHPGAPNGLQSARTSGPLGADVVVASRKLDASARPEQHLRSMRRTRAGGLIPIRVGVVCDRIGEPEEACAVRVHDEDVRIPVASEMKEILVPSVDHRGSSAPRRFPYWSATVGSESIRSPVPSALTT